jgi:hypothetical protein
MFVGFAGVSTAHALVLELAPGSTERLTWGTVVLLGFALIYLAVGAVLREAFSRARLAVRGSPTRGLWVALDIPLRCVVGAERGTEQASRFLVIVGFVAGVAGALARVGAPLAGAAAVGTLGIAVLGEATSHVIALRTAAQTTARRAPPGLWELYLAVLGLLVGLALPSVLRFVPSVDASRVPGILTGGGAGALRAVAGALVAAGLVGAACAVRGIIRAPVGDVPALAVDAASVVAEGVTFGRLTGKPGAFGAVAWGNGSMTVQPAALSAFRALLAGCGVAVGVRLSVGPVLRDAVVRGLPIASAAHAIAVVLVAALSGFVAVIAVVTSGQARRLWQYRALWEQGHGAVTLWSAHIAGGVAQSALLGGVVMIGLAALTGRVSVTVLVVATVTVLGDHLADSLFARGERPDGEGVSGAAASGVVSFVLAVPAFVGALAGGVWTPVIGAYTLALAGVGYACFAVRLRALPRVALQ